QLTRINAICDECMDLTRIVQLVVIELGEVGGVGGDEPGVATTREIVGVQFGERSFERLRCYAFGQQLTEERVEDVPVNERVAASSRHAKLRCRSVGDAPNALASRELPNRLRTNSKDGGQLGQEVDWRLEPALAAFCSCALQ